MPKSVALILLNWNTPEYTASCITSVQQNCDAADYDLIIADNGSTDGSLNKLRLQFPDLIFIDNKTNLGYAGGNNTALEYALNHGYTYSLVMNNDTTVGRGMIRGLIDHLDQHPRAAAAQPAIYWMHEPEKLWNAEGRFQQITGKVYAVKKPTTREMILAEWLTGCCILLRNSVLRECGLFNSRFFLYYEDVELSFRLRAAGYELHYLPRLSMYHEAGASGQVSAQKEGTLSPVIHYYVSRNHIWFLRKYGNPLFYPVMFLFYTPYYAALLGYFLIRGRKKKASCLFNGLKDGLFESEKVIWPKIDTALKPNS